MADPGIPASVVSGLSAAEREASFYLRRAADHRREAKIARAEGDETVARIFDAAAVKGEKVANEFRTRLRDVWAPGISVSVEKSKCRTIS